MYIYHLLPHRAITTPLIIFSMLYLIDLCFIDFMLICFEFYLFMFLPLLFAFSEFNLFFFHLFIKDLVFFILSAIASSKHFFIWSLRSLICYIFIFIQFALNFISLETFPLTRVILKHCNLIFSYLGIFQKCFCCDFYFNIVIHWKLTNMIEFL